MVSAEVSSDKAPWLGSGRRTVPVFVLQDKEMKKYIKERGKIAITKLDELREWRSETQNPQQILHSLKMDIREQAIERQKKLVPMLTKDIDATKKALKDTTSAQKPQKRKHKPKQDS